MFINGLSLWYYYKIPDFFEWLSLYFIKSYIGITTLMSLVWSISLLFISLMHLVNGAQFWNVTFLFVLLGTAAASVFSTALVHLISMKAPL